MHSEFGTQTGDAIKYNTEYAQGRPNKRLIHIIDLLIPVPERNTPCNAHDALNVRAMTDTPWNEHYISISYTGMWTVLSAYLQCHSNCINISS